MTDKIFSSFDLSVMHEQNMTNDESSAGDIFFEQQFMLNKFVYGKFITVNFKKMYHRDASWCVEKQKAIPPTQ